MAANSCPFCISSLFSHREFGPSNNFVYIYWQFDDKFKQETQLPSFKRYFEIFMSQNFGKVEFGFESSIELKDFYVEN